MQDKSETIYTTKERQHPDSSFDLKMSEERGLHQNSGS